MADTYATLTGLRNAMQAFAEAAVTVGNVLTHYEPIPKKREWLDTYMVEIGGEMELRGMLISPSSPFQDPKIAAVGAGNLNIEDTYHFDLTVFRAAESSDDTERQAALERACDIVDALRTNWNLTAYSVSVSRAMASIQRHGFGMVGGRGCWLTEISVSYVVNQDYAVT